jgi:NTE family protein
MDASTLPRSAGPRPIWRPAGCDHVALVLQGGGALGAYQGGVYQALHEAGLEPDWVAGVSIGGINAAILAGNPRERRLERLQAFWNLVTSGEFASLYKPDGDTARKTRSIWSSWLALSRGQPGFFSPNLPGPWLSPRGGRNATAFYDNAKLRETLLRLVDFDLINTDRVRFAVGAVNVGTGNFTYFDNAITDIVPEHVMASAALPPALPMMRIGTDWYWDGGLVSNTPLQHLLDHIGPDNTLVLQVDLFSARGAIPRDMYDVLARQKDIQYSSRTRLTTDYYKQMHQQNVKLRSLLARIPDEDLTEEECALKQRLAHLPEIAILHLIYQQAPYEGQAKDYDFSAASMREHWEAGVRDTQRTLRRKEWLVMPGPETGIAVHDVHRIDD